MRPRRVLPTVLTALVCLAAKPGPSPIALPSELADYKTWTRLLKEPQPVPMHLWLRCVPATPAQWAEARKEHGPHTERYIQVYGNPTAVKGMAKGNGVTLPYDSILAKEKLPILPDAPADGIGFMIRHAPPAFAATDGWEFVFAPSSGNPHETHEACAACHRGAPGQTYVFGSYLIARAKVSARKQTENTRELTARFVESRDYPSLERLVAHLNVGMRRADVESLLGQPEICFAGSYCYYPSNRMNVYGKTLILFVDYGMISSAAGSARMDDRVEAYSIAAEP